MIYTGEQIHDYGMIYHGDALEVLPELVKEGVKADLILTDLPYGTTHCKWDTTIDLDVMWEYVDEICHDSTPALLFSQQPFTTTLINSNIKEYRYSWIWEKTLATGHLNAKKMPLKAHEEICVFYKKLPFYNPIKTTGHTRKVIKASHKEKCNPGDIYNRYDNYSDYDSTERYPRSVLKYATDRQFSYFHTNQKPVGLLEYFIQTYTKENDVVIDFTMGSGSTGIACERCNRRFIGIEKEKDIYLTAKQRLIHGSN